VKPKLMRRVAYLGRPSTIFFFISLAGGSALIASGVLSGILLLGDRAALAPLIVELSEPFPPPGYLPFAQLIANWAGLAFLALAAIVWLLWVFSATLLLKAAGLERLHHGPFSAVAMHFVPVLAWAMPMLIMTELERGTRDPAQWRYLKSSGLAATSWVVGKLSLLTFGLGIGLEPEAVTADQYATALRFSLAGAAGCVFSLYLFNRYLKHMAALQVALAAKIDGPKGEAEA
jgi:hypothetical protein